MAKSLKSKREKRLKAIRREIVKPLYDKKLIDRTRFRRSRSRLVASKLTIRVHKSAMELIEPDSAATATTSSTGGYMGMTAMAVVGVTRWVEEWDRLRPTRGTGGIMI